MNRFDDMISIMNGSIKGRRLICSMPVDNVCLAVLRLLRNNGYIWGFSYSTPGKRSSYLYPRVKIYLKYVDIESPVLKGIKVFKKTKSNFQIIQYEKLHQVLAQNKRYILTTPKGYVITSMDDIYHYYTEFTNMYSYAAILAELFI